MPTSGDGMSTHASTTAPVQVIERAGALLACFTAVNPSPSLSECAALAGLNKSSAYRILLSLEAIGLVERSGKRWRIGLRTVALAGVRLGQYDLRREASARLRRVGAEFRAAVALAVPAGSMMAYVERYESPEPFAPSARLGALAPIWAGAAGRAVLSRLSPAERERHLDDDEWRRLTADRRNSVLEEIERAAECGYATDAGSFFQGVAGVASPICDARGHPVATLSLIVSPERLDHGERERMGTYLLGISHELEVELASHSFTATAIPTVPVGQDED